MVSPRPYVYINIHKLSLNSFIPLICEILPIRLIRKRVSEFIFFFFSFTIFFSNCSNLGKRFYRIRRIIFFLDIIRELFQEYYIKSNFPQLHLFEFESLDDLEIFIKRYLYLVSLTDVGPRISRIYTRFDPTVSRRGQPRCCIAAVQRCALQRPVQVNETHPFILYLSNNNNE